MVWARHIGGSSSATGEGEGSSSWSRILVNRGLLSEVSWVCLPLSISCGRPPLFFLVAFFLPSFLRPSLTRGSSYPQRPAGQAIVIGVLPFPPRHSSSFRSREGFSSPTVRQFHRILPNRMPHIFSRKQLFRRPLSCLLLMDVRQVMSDGHYDGSRNMVALLAGKRRWILSKPQNCRNLHMFRKGHPSGRWLLGAFPFLTTALMYTTIALIL